MNNEASQKLQKSGGAEREAREVAEEINRRNQRRNHVLRDGFGNIAPIMPTEEMAGIIAAALEKCANEARLEALEQAACEIDKCNQEGPYQAIAGAERIRALKAAQHGEKELRKAQ